MLYKVAIITGSTRGIGRQLALDLARKGYNITVTGKTIESTQNLPGNIYSVSEEVKDIGVDALPYQLDVRYDTQMVNCIKETYDKWGRIDVLINNAGALWWKSILETPNFRYDLINDINSRASFIMSKEAIPYMLKNDGGNIINFSPPFSNGKELSFNISDLKGKTAYLISKFGMTLGAMGIAEEFRGKGISSNTLWPLRPVESYALINHKLGKKKHWRKSSIISDSVLKILEEDKNTFTGHQLIDEDYLRSKGIIDFDIYNCVPGSRPPKLNDVQEMWNAGKAKL